MTTRRAESTYGLRSLLGWPRAILYSAEVRSNRAWVSRRLTQHDLEVAWLPVGDTDSPGRVLSGGGDVVPGCSVLLTTCDRPEPCRRLLEALAAQPVASDMPISRIIVLDDASVADYSAVREALARESTVRVDWYRAARRHGRSGFWRTYQFGFDLVRRLAAGPVLFLQDDLDLVPGFWPEAWRTWQAIADPAKAVLSLCAMEDDEVRGRWIAFERVQLPGQPYRLTQWFDLQAFLVEPRFFELLRYQVLAVPAGRWRRRTDASSGVGEQFTRRLWRRGNVYQVVRTLVLHGSEPSLMNPGARSRRALDNYGAPRVPSEPGVSQRGWSASGGPRRRP
ncbi:MAG TPA: hypothetical protein PLN93_01545 [Vicinamibacterales bacterium]|nr:hypothetical protein [Vicinamibacterales bacterium]HOQ60308.1 hypothetical protein [Vicinamibacterales bacterium]HPK70600.1 hypothetical protein [Vicinamibacterales bacterium]